MAEPKTKTSPTVKAVAIFAAVFVGIAIIMMFTSYEPTSPARHTDSIGRQIPASVTNDAQLLLYRCGQPDLDDSTAYDQPRPYLVTRWIEFRKYHLRFIFMPDDRTMPGDPPPYQWKLLAVTDTNTDQPITAAEAIKRMPCWAGK